MTDSIGHNNFKPDLRFETHWELYLNDNKKGTYLAKSPIIIHNIFLTILKLNSRCCWDFQHSKIIPIIHIFSLSRWNGDSASGCKKVESIASFVWPFCINASNQMRKDLRLRLMTLIMQVKPMSSEYNVVRN